MNRKVFFLFVIAALLFVVLPITVISQEGDAPSRSGLRPDAPAYGVRGPYPVGAMELIVDAGTEDEIALIAWYPALNPNMAPEAITYQIRSDAAFRQYVGPDMPLSIEGRALRDAEADLGGAPYPLVVLSHAFTGSAEFEFMRGEHLASYGFMVLAPNHETDTWETSIFKCQVERANVIQRVITFAESLTAPDGEMPGLIDLEHVAVGGWSAGAMTSYDVAGGRLDWSYIEQFCDEHPEANECGVDLEDQQQMTVDAAGLEDAPEGLWPAMTDSRVDAIFPLAGVTFAGEEGLASINVPVLALFGSGEPVRDVNRYASAYDLVASPRKAEVEFANANHFIFSAACDATPWLVDPMGAFSWCSDTVWDMSRAHDLINHFTTAFLLAELYGDEDARAALAPDAVNFPGIGYEAVGY